MSLFIAAQTAFLKLNGERHKIVKDCTVVRGGHPILEGHEHLFKPLHVHYDCERPKPVTPPVAPPIAPPAKVVQAKPAAAKAETSEPAEEE